MGLGTEIMRFLQPIKTKIFLLIGRSILTAIKNSEKIQKVQISGLNGETITDVERMQEYGFETYPLNDGNDEATAIFINANREKGLVICIGNREYRPKDLLSGEVKIYCKSGTNESLNYIKLSPTKNTIKINTKDGDVILCDDDGIVVTCKNNNKIEMLSAGIKLTCKNGNTIDMVAGEVKVNGTNLEVLQ